MKVHGVRSLTALYFVVRGHRLSLQSPLSLGESHSVSGLKMKGLDLMALPIVGSCEDPAWTPLGRSWFSFQEMFRNQTDNGFLN